MQVSHGLDCGKGASHSEEMTSVDRTCKVVQDPVLKAPSLDPRTPPYDRRALDVSLSGESAKKGHEGCAVELWWLRIAL